MWNLLPRASETGARCLTSARCGVRVEIGPRSARLPGMADAIPQTHADLLDKSGILHLASLGRGGEPQVHPVWYDWDGTHLLVSSTAPRQKTKNLERDGRVAGCVTDPENPYRYLEIRGTVEAIEPDPTGSLIHALAKKYLNEDRYPWEDDTSERVIIRIRPEKTNTMG